MKEHHTESLLRPLNDWERKHAPKTIWTEGDETLLRDGLRVSVVGSRKASPAGIARANVFCKALVKRGITVVSGLAEGIDSVAHTTAIEENGKTIAVLGTSLEECYPKKNGALLEHIKRSHLAISQFPPGYPMRKDNFPRRNRTMALISDATVIIEASEMSGTKHQGWEAIRLGRFVFILESVATDSKLSWPKEMIEYGAQVIRRDTLDLALDNIPPMTEAGVELAF